MKVWEAIEKFFLSIARKLKLGVLADFYEAHIEGMRYLVFGALSTLVNILTYFLCSNLIFQGLGDIAKVNISEGISFIVAVIFAYITNKICVFQSKTDSKKGLFREMVSFLGCRLFTEAISFGMMNFAIVIQFNDNMMKIIANIVVIILNFIFSKIWIFKKET